MSLLENFQKQLRNRLQLKAQKNQSEENVLFKTFKFYDIQNRGEIQQADFMRAMDKIGLQVFTEDVNKICSQQLQELIHVFNAFDSRGTGLIDYKEFSTIVCRSTQFSEAGSSYLESQTSMSQSQGRFSGQRNQSQINFSTQKTLMEPVQDLLKRFKDLIQARGVRGLIGLQKILKKVDNEGKGRISLQQFKKALFDFRLENLQDQELEKLFNLYDRKRLSLVNVKDVINSLRDEMNDYRKELVERVFIILDRDDDGMIDIKDIRQNYNPKRHPDVMQGKRSQETILSEFIESFEENHILITGASTSRIPQINFDEFMEYYTNLGTMIDSDEYFSIMISNVWNISGGSQSMVQFNSADYSGYGSSNKLGSGGLNDQQLQSNNSQQRSVYHHMKEGENERINADTQSVYSYNQQVPRGGKTSNENPLVSAQTNKYYQRQEDEINQRNADRQQMNQNLQDKKNYSPMSQAPSMRSERSVASSVFHTEKIQLAKYQTILVERFRSSIATKGIKGLIALRDKFRDQDSSNNGTLSFQCFNKVIKDMRFDVPEIDIKNAFKAFDINGEGQVFYDEFVKVLIGPMNKYRTSYVEKAFDKLDINQQGLVDIDYIFQKYDGAKHPDYRLGKATKKEIEDEFEQTFETHHQVVQGYQALEKISKLEFIEYYAHVSALIESDSQFANLVSSVWSLDYRDNPDILPFAGSKQKVLTVDPKQRYYQDNFKAKYGNQGSGNAPYGTFDDTQSSTSSWVTTNQRQYNN
ncbi:ef hand family protein [Stylonychia lemnae]|uniref:Ef hand family protein n=1 Tax=Stylonychia lemnae TaxID=5949 RepID=A0A078AGC9_STYLE|nr:ef hand family protein [Stylonychia lemnae]|eukprot:CDW79898.1 ef hand family protein [Stylonychia lemnae]